MMSFETANEISFAFWCFHTPHHMYNKLSEDLVEMTQRCNWCWQIVNSIWTNFSEIGIMKGDFIYQENAIEIVVCEMSAILLTHWLLGNLNKILDK